MTRTRLELTRRQVLAFRRQAGALDERLPAGRGSLRRAAWAGLQDSMPRAALLSIHARVADTGPAAWEDPSLVQLWGPRYSVFVVAARDLAVFSLGTLPEDEKGRRRAEDLAARLHAVLDGTRMTYGQAGDALGVNPNSLRYAAATGTVLIRWEGARLPVVWTVPPPQLSAADARLELARRYLHSYGPTTPEAFRRWAYVSLRSAAAVFETLGTSLTPVRTPVGDAWILARDEAAIRAAADPGPAAPARLLPSGDAYFLLYAADRALLVPDEDRRNALWTSRVWPGALLVGEEIAGTWRRAGPVITAQPWRALSGAERDAVAAEAESLPLPGAEGKRITVRWDGLPGHPQRGAVPVQALGCLEGGDHDLDRLPGITGQLVALRRRVALVGAELPRRGDHGGGQAGKFGGVLRVERPGRSSGRDAQGGDLLPQPGPRVGGQRGIPVPLRRFVAVEPRVEVGHAEAPGRVGQPVEQVGPPQRAVGDDQLGRRLAAPVRLRRQLADLDPGPVLHGGVVKVDLEPVPDDHGRVRKSQNVLHRTSLPCAGRQAQYALWSRPRPISLSWSRTRGSL